jgi:hypothetical protein
MVRDDLAGQGHLAVELGGIEDEKNGLGPRLAFDLSAQGAHGDALVLRRGHRLVALQTPDAGQVEQAGARSLDQPFVLLHGDAGVVANLLAQAGEPVEDGGLAYIGGANNRYCTESWQSAFHPDGDEGRRRLAQGDVGVVHAVDRERAAGDAPDQLHMRAGAEAHAAQITEMRVVAHPRDEGVGANGEIGERNRLRTHG